MSQVEQDPAAARHSAVHSGTGSSSDAGGPIDMLEAMPTLVSSVFCSEHGCESQTTIPCTYIDRRALACETGWCENHVVLLDGLPLCRRHASVMCAISEEERRTPPDRNNRAPSLVQWVAQDLDPDIRAALDRVKLPGDQFYAEPAHLAHIGPQRVRAWVRSWKLMDHTGFSHWVTVDVPEASQTEVAIRVDGNVVAHAEPPWIKARHEGVTLSPEEDAEQRRQFRDDLAARVREHLLRPRAL
jgi:hypothetical protein